MKSATHSFSTPPDATPMLPWAQEVASTDGTSFAVEGERLTVIPPSPNGAAGLHSGLHWRDNRPAAFTRICRTCGREFAPKARSVERGSGWHCSHSCASKSPRPRPAFHTPDSSKIERVRANGLVNKRRKLGWFKPPANCQRCGAAKRLDSHHPDYAKPDEVLWLCRSCHMKAHNDPTTIAGLTPVRLNKQPFAAAAPCARRGGNAGKGARHG